MIAESGKRAGKWAGKRWRSSLSIRAAKRRFQFRFNFACDCHSRRMPGHNIHKQIFIFQWPEQFRAEWSQAIFPGFLPDFLNAVYGRGSARLSLYGFSAFVRGRFPAMVFRWWFFGCGRWRFPLDRILDIRNVFGMFLSGGFSEIVLKYQVVIRRFFLLLKIYNFIKGADIIFQLIFWIRSVSDWNLLILISKQQKKNIQSTFLIKKYDKLSPLIRIIYNVFFRYNKHIIFDRFSSVLPRNYTKFSRFPRIVIF